GEDVATDEALRRLVEREAGVHRAREAQDHHEAGQVPRRAADADPPEGCPVDLPLFAGHRLELEEGLARQRADLVDVAADDQLAALVAAFADHMEEARGPKPRMLSKDLFDESLVRVENRRHDTRLDRTDYVVVEDRPPDGVVVEAELRRDRADLP